MHRALPPRLPVPHLFIGLSAGLLALLTLAAVSDLRGSTISSSLAFPALLAITIRAGRSGVHGHGRPLLGLGAGLLTGLAAASSLVGLGAMPSGGPQWVFLPLVFATLGTMLGLTAPAQRSTAGVPRDRDATTAIGSRAAHEASTAPALSTAVLVSGSGQTAI